MALMIMLLLFGLLVVAVANRLERRHGGTPLGSVAVGHRVIGKLAIGIALAYGLISVLDVIS